MGRPKKIKEEEKLADEQVEETKKDEEDNDNNESDDLIMLATFKDINNLSNMEYAGLKSALNAKDDEKFDKTELENKLKEFKNQPAFKL